MSPAPPWAPYVAISLANLGGGCGCHFTDEEMEVRQGQGHTQHHTQLLSGGARIQTPVCLLPCVFHSVLF